MEPITRELRQALRDIDSFEEACRVTVRALRRYTAHYNWVGIYMRKGDELVLVAWDGPEATQHVRIPMGQGICGLAARAGETVIGEIDIDSDTQAAFTQADRDLIEEAASILTAYLSS